MMFLILLATLNFLNYCNLCNGHTRISEAMNFKTAIIPKLIKKSSPVANLLHRIAFKRTILAPLSSFEKKDDDLMK